MKYFYNLRISATLEQANKITTILSIEPNYPQLRWGYELIENEGDEYIDFINKFLNILEGKYDELERIGITREQISIWMIYEYEEQCNMEFSPIKLKRLGENGITLCISCYQNENYNEADEHL